MAAIIGLLVVVFLTVLLIVVFIMRDSG